MGSWAEGRVRKHPTALWGSSGQTQFPPISPLKVPTCDPNSLAFKTKRRALRTLVAQVLGF